MIIKHFIYLMHFQNIVIKTNEAWDLKQLFWKKQKWCGKRQFVCGMKRNHDSYISCFVDIKGDLPRPKTAQNYKIWNEQNKLISIYYNYFCVRSLYLKFLINIIKLIHYKKDGSVYTSKKNLSLWFKVLFLNHICVSTQSVCTFTLTRFYAALIFYHSATCKKMQCKKLLYDYRHLNIIC